MFSQKATIALFLALSTSVSTAIMAPGNIEQMKHDTDEELFILVDSVSPLLGQKPGCITYAMATATVIDVKHGDYQPGEKIQFSTYSYDINSMECQGFTGPASPPELQDGWCGVALLNQATTPNGPLSLAAYGDSLKQAPDNMCKTEGHRKLVLGPGVTEDMKTNADEKLLIQVDSVILLLGQTPSCVNYSMVSATVMLAPEGKQQSYQPGDKVEFQIYSYDWGSNACQGFVAGPSAPPALVAGWCGLAYLNNGVRTPDAPLVLAAYGDSLEEAPANLCLATVLPSGDGNSEPNNGGSNRMLRGSKD